MHKPWIGTRRVAFLPIVRPIDSAPPADFTDQVTRRVFFDPDPATGQDRSLRAYIKAISSGRADIEGHVREAIRSDTNDLWAAATSAIPPTAYLDCVGVVAVNADAGGGGSAFPHDTYFRTHLGAGVGEWAHELAHTVTGFGDLYNITPNLNTYDNMACGCGTHPSAYTKLALHWLDESTIAPFRSPTQKASLHAIGLIQPPPPGRSGAVRIASLVPPKYFMVEARLRVPPFESGIASEGVIVYEVHERAGDPNFRWPDIYLRTPTALLPGQTYMNAEEELSVHVIRSIPGGFDIGISRPEASECARLRDAIAKLLSADELDVGGSSAARRRRHTRVLSLMHRLEALGCSDETRPIDPRDRLSRERTQPRLASARASSASRHQRVS